MRIGIADTTFSRVDMASIAIAAIKSTSRNIEIERYTVPGCKDLAVASKKLIEEYGCDIVLALGWVGKEPIDGQCAHEANLGLINAELQTNHHILKIFIHEREAQDATHLLKIAMDRTEKHARNALSLLKCKDELTPNAGKGKRQGGSDAGRLL